MKAIRLAIALVLIVAGLATSSASHAAGQQTTEPAVYIWQVDIADQDDIDELVNGGYDLVESRGVDYLLVVGTQAVADQLQDEGFTVRIDRELTARAGGAAQTYYFGYRTFDEHVEHLADVQAAYPELATVHDYGDSWRKMQGRTNNDLLVICLTNKQPGDCALNPNSAKPRAVIMAAIHARELQTSEVAWRLIDELVEQYGIDADITHILDTTEVWIIPVANPDGREIAESGGNNPYMQRKNGNDTVGNCSLPATTFNHHGVDLNRNASWSWGGAGTTLDPCAQTYRGTGPASEPEQSALETLFSQLWPDQKGPAWDDPVAANATGSFITIHSFGELILIPNGENGQLAPNDAELRAFAFRMANFNQYVVGTGPEILYATSGTTDDHVYYDLGVPSFTYELSPRNGPCSGFAPMYACIDANIWPRNRDALLYSMKVAGDPYNEVLGPITEMGFPARITEGEPFVFVAEADDDAYGDATGSFNRPAGQTVDQIKYWIDQSPDEPDNDAGVAMSPSDGSFDGPRESGDAIVDEQLAPGEHTMFVRARNAAGYWGPVAAKTFIVEPSGPDVNRDGSINDADVQALLEYQVGNQPDPLSTFAADVNRDGSISILDALELAQLILQ